MYLEVVWGISEAVIAAVKSSSVKQAKIGAY